MEANGAAAGRAGQRAGPAATRSTCIAAGVVRVRRAAGCPYVQCTPPRQLQHRPDKRTLQGRGRDVSLYVAPQQGQHVSNICESHLCPGGRRGKGGRQTTARAGLQLHMAAWPPAACTAADQLPRSALSAQLPLHSNRNAAPAPSSASAMPASPMPAPSSSARLPRTLGREKSPRRLFCRRGGWVAGPESGSACTHGRQGARRQSCMAGRAWPRPQAATPQGCKPPPPQTITAPCTHPLYPLGTDDAGIPDCRPQVGRIWVLSQLQPNAAVSGQQQGTAAGSHAHGGSGVQRAQRAASAVVAGSSVLAPPSASLVRPLVLQQRRALPTSATHPNSSCSTVVLKCVFHRSNMLLLGPLGGQQRRKGRV